MLLGLRPSSFEFINQAISLLKRDLLYFDQVHICSKGKYNIFDELEASDPRHFDKLQLELEPLRKARLIHNFQLDEMLKHTMNEFSKRPISKEDYEDFKAIGNEFFATPNFIGANEFKKNAKPTEQKKIVQKYIRSINESEAHATRISGLFLNRFSAQDEAFPILTTELGPQKSTIFKRGKVLDVILNKLPIPDEKVSMQQLIEFKNDPDSREKFLALRVWMQDLTRGDYSVKEIEERLEHNLLQYENHLNFHKMKHQHGALRIFVTTAADILENLAKLRFSKLAETLFSIGETNLDLAESERNAPGREIAYISKAGKELRAN